MLRNGKSARATAAPPPGAGAPDPAEPGPSRRGSLVERIAGWSVRHRVVALAAWFTLVAAAAVSSSLIPGDTVGGTDPGDSGRADRVLDAPGTYVPSLENVLIQRRAPGGPRYRDDPELRSATADLAAELRRAPGAVSEVRSPLDRDGGALVSADGRSGLLAFRLAGPYDHVAAHYDTAVRAVESVRARHPRVRLAQAGDRSLSRAVDEGIKGDFERAEFVSLPLTVVILLVVFGSLIAMGIPLLLAVSTVIGTFGLLQTIAHWIPVNSATSSMVLLIGMAVGIDYTLFYLRREREERVNGHGVAAALRIAARTSGRVVVVSGLTVMLCVSGLLFTGLDNFRGLTVGAVVVVGLAMVGSVTVLPALLALLGSWVDRGRVPWLGRRRTTATESRMWSAVARTVVRRPVLWGGAAALALAMLALPALGMRLQDAAVTDSLPRSVPVVDAALRMQQAFPGTPSQARVAVWRAGDGPVDGPAVRRAIEELRGRAGSERALNEPISVDRVGDALLVRVPLADFRTGDTANRALETLRRRILPETLGRVAGVDYAVAGRTAVAYDFTERVNARTPIVFVFVLSLAFVLLMLAFRSVVIAAVSIALNLLSIGAAYGVVTWGFQDGHLAGALGFTAYGGVVGWLPLFMFVILFGLSMDYHIFILSRIRERWARGEDRRPAIVAGVAGSAGVVTGAAVIMTGVFSVFVLLTAVEYKMMGIGMATAVIIDATIVRGVLLPAALALAGSVHPRVDGHRIHPRSDHPGRADS